MADTTFIDGSTLTTADWFNDLNRLHYTIFGDPADVAAVKDTLHSAPGAIGDGTPAAGSFTTLTATGGAQVTGAALLGYGPGAGGAVTQATDKSTAVTLNKPCGEITMNNATLNANAVVQFLMNNSLVGATDVCIANIGASVAPGNYHLQASPALGGVYFNLRNVSAGNLSETVVVRFSIIKGVTS